MVKLTTSRCVSEFVGTMTLVCSIKLILFHANQIEFSAPDNVNEPKANLFSGIFQGFALMAVVYLFGYNSFGMFNPAVTIAHAIRNEDQFKRVEGTQWMKYIISQWIGSVCGGFLALAIGGHAAGREYFFVRYPERYLTEAFLSELLFSFILVSVHVHSVSDKRIAGNQFFGIAIGSVRAIASVAIRPITGCALNPCVWFGSSMAAWYTYQKDNVEMQNGKYSWIYPCAQFLSGICAGCWYRIVYAPYERNEADGYDPAECDALEYQEIESEEEKEEEENQEDVSRISHILAWEDVTASESHH